MREIRNEPPQGVEHMHRGRSCRSVTIHVATARQAKILSNTRAAIEPEQPKRLREVAGLFFSPGPGKKWPNPQKTECTKLSFCLSRGTLEQTISDHLISRFQSFSEKNGIGWFPIKRPIKPCRVVPNVGDQNPLTSLISAANTNAYKS